MRISDWSSDVCSSDLLALKSVLPDLPMIAALSANHLAALDLAPMLTRLYVARDRDAAGRMAAERLHARGRDAGIEVRDLMPARSDFRSEEHTSELQVTNAHLVCRLLLETKKKNN